LKDPIELKAGKVPIGAIGVMGAIGAMGVMGVMGVMEEKEFIWGTWDIGRFIEFWEGVRTGADWGWE
jgi:hypothetical protein